MTKMTFSFPNIVLVFLDSRVDEKQALWMEMSQVNSRVNEKQPLVDGNVTCEFAADEVQPL
jgi:hypothetical protein